MSVHFKTPPPPPNNIGSFLNVFWGKCTVGFIDSWSKVKFHNSKPYELIDYEV